MNIRKPLVFLDGYIQELPSSDVTSDENMMYSKRTDFVGNDIYRGEAAVGSSESAAVWRIRRIVESSDGDISEKWAEGSSDFSFVWANRLTYNYT